MTTDTRTGLRNFSLFIAFAILVTFALPWLKEVAAESAPQGTHLTAGVILLKLLAKLAPILAALVLAYCISARHGSMRRHTPRSLLRWPRSRVVDAYCFIVAHLHRVIGLLTLVFTLGLPFMLDRLIAGHVPAEWKLFPLIAQHAGLAAAAIAFVIVATFFNYWEHRFWHTRIMWPIHRFHHSASDYNPLVEARKHFTEVLLTPIFFTLPMTLLGAPPEFVAGYLTLVLFQGFMNHTDEAISYGWVGRTLWCDPVYHKTHHSCASEHINKNFSGTLPIWDRLFGTYAAPHAEMRVGTPDAPHYEHMPYWKIYVQDLADFAGNLARALRRRPQFRAHAVQSAPQPVDADAAP